MTIRLISGIPGSGKTLYAVSELVKIIEKNVEIDEPRKIYCDITGLKITDIEPPPIDWRKTPPRSLLIYDEAQLRPEFAQKRGRSGYEFIDQLTIHRKTGHEIWFITQDPKRLHADILEMVEIHHHLERPYGAKLATIYEYRGAERNPRAESVKNRAENKKIFNYDKSLFDYYESSQVDDGIKMRLPKQLIFWLAIALAIPAYLIYNVFVSDNLDGFIDSSQAGTKGQSETPIQTQAQAQTTPSQEPIQPQISQEQAQITQNQELIEAQRRYIQQLEAQRLYYYENWLPKGYEVIKAEPVLQVRGVIKMGNTCRAYNTYGDLLTLSPKECKYYMAQSGRVHKSQAQIQAQNTPTIAPVAPQVAEQGVGQGNPQTEPMNVPKANILSNESKDNADQSPNL